MRPPLRRALCALLALLVALPATGAVGTPAAPVRTLKQPIDWVPQNVVEAQDLPPLAAPSAEPTGPAVPVLYEGIGPGSALLLGATVGTVGFLCTAAFVFKEPLSGEYYLATAGHCLVRDENEPSPHSGYVDPNTTNNEVRICVRQCLDNALQLGTYVRLYRGMPGAPAGYDPVVFAQSGGIGTDFGLIRIPPVLNNQIRPYMPQFGGPSGMADETRLGDLIVHYGHGSYCCVVIGILTRTPADQGRVAVSLGSDAWAFDFSGWSTPGDSGSGMSLAQTSTTRGIQGTAALGVLTHGIPVGGEGSGTLLPRGLQMVRGYQATHATLPANLAGLALVKGDAAICTANCSSVPPPEPAVHVTSPASGATVQPEATTVSGTVNRAESAAPQSAALPLSPLAASLVHPVAGQDLYMQSTLPEGNADRATGGANLVEAAPTLPAPAVSAQLVTTGATEAVSVASWTYHGAVDLNDADVKVTWYGRQATNAATEDWEAHVYVGATQIASATGPHASATGTFASDPNAKKELILHHVHASGQNLVLALRPTSATTPAVVLYGSAGYPSGIRVTELGGTQSNEPPVAAFSCTSSGLTLTCDASASTDDEGIAGYQWAWGGGITSTGATGSHTYSTPGNKTVGLTVTDTDGATGTASRTYPVAGTPPLPERVELRVDGALAATATVDSTSGGEHAWSGTVDFSAYAAGPHNLTAVWLDGSTELDRTTLPVTVASGTTGTGTSTQTTTTTTTTTGTTTTDTTSGAATGTNTGAAGGTVNNVAPAVDALTANPSVATIGRDGQVNVHGSAHDDNGQADIAAVTVRLTAPGGSASNLAIYGPVASESDITALSYSATHAIAPDAETGTYQVDSFATDDDGAQSDVVSVTFTVLPAQSESVDVAYTGGADRLDFGSFNPGAHNVTSANAFTVTNNLGHPAHFLFDMSDFACTRGAVAVMGNANVVLGSVDGSGAFAPIATKPYAETTVDFGTLSDGSSLAVKLMLHSVPKGVEGLCTASFGLYHS